MSVTTADGVSATLVQPNIYRGAVAPTSAAVGDLWEDTSTNPPVFKQCSVAPSTFVPVGATTLTAGTGLTLSSNTLSITNTGVTAGTYGTASNIPAVTVNAQGQITAITTNSVQGMVYPPTGIPFSTGTAWGTSYTTSGTGTVVPLATGATISTATIPDYTTFASQSTNPTYNAGTLWYAQDNDALTFYNGVTGNDQHLGQEVQLRVYNNTGSTIPMGSIVYINGQHSQFPTVALAQANSYATAQALGAANTAIANNSYGYIVTLGKFTGYNTSTFSSGDILYVSPTTAGAITNVAPTAPNFAVKIGACIYSNPANGVIIIDRGAAAQQPTTPNPSPILLFDNDVQEPDIPYVPGPQGLQGPQGTPGATGATGPQGPTGPSVVLWMPGDDGEEGQPGRPGASGSNGNTGAQGPMGPAIYLEADYPEPDIPHIPGVPGPAGVSGVAGAPGPAIFLEADYQEQEMLGFNSVYLSNVTNNLARGATGSIPYQTAASTTGMLGLGSNSQVLSIVSSTPAWINQAGIAAGSATNIAGGAYGQIPYQTGSTLTSFIPAPITANTFLEWTGSNFSWAAAGGGGGGSAVTSIGNQMIMGGTNTFSGLSGFTQMYLLVWSLSSFSGSGIPVIQFNGTSSGYNYSYTSSQFGLISNTGSFMSNFPTSYSMTMGFFSGYAFIIDIGGGPQIIMSAYNGNGGGELYQLGGATGFGSLMSISLSTPTGASGNVALYQFN